MKDSNSLEKMLSSKSKVSKQLTPDEVKAKTDVLHEMLSMAHAALGDKVQHGMEGMKQVTVAAPNKDGLLGGLNMAKELASGNPHEMHVDSPKMDDMETELMEEKTGEDLDHDGEMGEDKAHIAKMMQAKHDKQQESDKSPVSMIEDEDEDSLFNEKRKKDKMKTVAKKEDSEY
jgi:hypothetical protein